MKSTPSAGELWRLTAKEIVAGTRAREFSVREVVTDCLARCATTNPRINAITELRADAALAAADTADRALRQGEQQGVLHGVPVTIKGCVDVAGWATVNGCAALRDNIAPRNSPAVQNWLDTGAIIIGRTNTPEFCCRWETSNEVFGQTLNPWDPQRTPGGSSGGAAASLAVGITPLAHGTDLGGSLRQPAQACGVVSLRPGLGRVPSWNPTDAGEPGPGVQIMGVDGVMGRCIDDLHSGLTAMYRGDWHDPWWMPVPLAALAAGVGKAALVVDPGGQGVSSPVASGVHRGGRLLADAGFAVTEISPPGILDAARIWRVICIGELLTQLQPAVRNICGERLRRTFDCYRAALPEFSLPGYMAAFAERRRVLRDWLEFFQEYPVIVAPVGTEPPLAPDADISSPEVTIALIESLRMVVAVNALGLPAVVVPVGIADAMPQAVQIIGPPFSELRCLAVAAVIEQACGLLTPIEPHAVAV